MSEEEKAELRRAAEAARDAAEAANDSEGDAEACEAADIAWLKLRDACSPAVILALLSDLERIAAERDALKVRLEMWASDGTPLPPHLDGIACRDETIRLLTAERDAAVEDAEEANARAAAHCSRADSALHQNDATQARLAEAEAALREIADRTPADVPDGTPPLQAMLAWAAHSAQATRIARDYFAAKGGE